MSKGHRPGKKITKSSMKLIPGPLCETRECLQQLTRIPTAGRQRVWSYL